MQHEWIGISAELGHDEGHPLNHQGGDKGYVARQSIELGNNHRAFGLTCKRKCGCQLRPAIQSIRALAGFDFRELLDDANPLGLGEVSNSSTLRLDAKT